MLGIDKVFDYYCSANNIKPEQMNEMIIGLLVLVVLIQIITAIINTIVQFKLKDRDVDSNFVAGTYTITRSVYEHIYKNCKSYYRDIITSTSHATVESGLNDITNYIGDNDIHISNKMRDLCDDMIDKLHLFNNHRTTITNKEVNKIFVKFKSEYKKHDNY